MLKRCSWTPPTRSLESAQWRLRPPRRQATFRVWAQKIVSQVPLAGKTVRTTHRAERSTETSKRYATATMLHIRPNYRRQYRRSTQYLHTKTTHYEVLTRIVILPLNARTSLAPSHPPSMRIHTSFDHPAQYNRTGTQGRNKNESYSQTEVNF